MVVEEYDDFLGFPTTCPIVGIPKCRIDRKAGSFPMLIRQVIKTHYRFGQLVAGAADPEAWDPRCKSESVKD